MKHVNVSVRTVGTLANVFLKMANMLKLLLSNQ